MDINQAVVVVDEFLAGYRDRGWRAAEIRVRPSGDDADHIKVWFGFTGIDEKELDRLKQQPIDALRKAHPELAEVTIEVRGEVL